MAPPGEGLLYTGIKTYVGEGGPDARRGSSDQGGTFVPVRRLLPILGVRRSVGSFRSWEFVGHEAERSGVLGAAGESVTKGMHRQDRRPSWVSLRCHQLGRNSPSKRHGRRQTAMDVFGSTPQDPAEAACLMAHSTDSK
jgi:ribosomal protein L39E